MLLTHFPLHNPFILKSVGLGGGRVLGTNTEHAYVIGQAPRFCTNFFSFKLFTSALRKVLFLLFTDEETKAQKR